MSNVITPNSNLGHSADFADIYKEFEALTRTARQSDEGWAYSLGALTAHQVAILEEDIEHIVNTVPAKASSANAPYNPHQYRQAPVNSMHGTMLLAESQGPVERVAKGISKGVKSVVHGLPFRFGEELAINHMKPSTSGPGHIDSVFRWTGNVSVGPAKIMLRNKRGHAVDLHVDESALLVFEDRFLSGGTWHKFINTSKDRSRGSVSEGIS